MRLNNLLAKSENSAWAMFKLNFLLRRIIPFNAVHGIKLHSSTANQVCCVIPYKKANFNHLRGIHACALATVAEYSAGLILLKKINLKKYRLIMSTLKVDYHYQAKAACNATTKLSVDALQQLEHGLNLSGQTNIILISEIYDTEKNHIATVTTNWQLKAWKLVRTKL